MYKNYPPCKATAPAIEISLRNSSLGLVSLVFSSGSRRLRLLLDGARLVDDRLEDGSEDLHELIQVNPDARCHALELSQLELRSRNPLLLVEVPHHCEGDRALGARIHVSSLQPRVLFRLLETKRSFPQKITELELGCIF